MAKEFAVVVRGARSPEQKDYLVDTLLAAAAQADASADQYALLTEAVARAAVAGDAPRSLAAVDELARWFKVDALAIKAETLSKAATAAAARDPDTARQVATAALALLDTAGDQSELARSLAATAVGAARRVRDPELLKQANQRRLAVERAAKK